MKTSNKKYRELHILIKALLKDTDHYNLITRHIDKLRRTNYTIYKDEDPVLIHCPLEGFKIHFTVTKLDNNIEIEITSNDLKMRYYILSCFWNN